MWIALYYLPALILQILLLVAYIRSKEKWFGIFSILLEIIFIIASAVDFNNMTKMGNNSGALISALCDYIACFAYIIMFAITLILFGIISYKNKKKKKMEVGI